MVKINNNYEYPLPKINVNINKIELDIYGIIEKSFIVENISGGILSGNISSDIFNLKFEPSSWESNICEIKYTYNADDYELNTKIYGKIIITSNGGEVIIPVKFNIISQKLCIDGDIISSLETFTVYAHKNFQKAKEIFICNDFLKICNITDTNLSKLYNRLVLEVYKEVSLDNFLIISGKKLPAQVVLLKPKIDLKLKYLEDKKIRCKLPFKISGWGTIEFLLNSKEKWIEIPIDKININNIIDGQIPEAYCFINAKFIDNRISIGFIEVKYGNSNLKLEICVKRDVMFSVVSLKNSYNMEDKGTIRIINNTNEDVMIEIYSDKFVKFKSKKYFISSYAEIPFEIKLPKTFDLLKIPIYDASILVKAVIKGKQIKKHISVKITDINLD